MTDRESLEPVIEDHSPPPNGDGIARMTPPRAQQSYVPKESNFKIKNGYRDLLKLHKAFGGFDSDAALKEWKAWFREDVSGERKELLEACLFAHCLIPSIDGVWFDDTKYDDKYYDYHIDRETEYGKEKITNPVILKFRETLKKSPMLVSNCLQDLICDKFQSIYLGNRHEHGENWIRVAHIIWKKDKKGVIKTSKLPMKSLIEFILMDSEEKKSEIKRLDFSEDVRFRPIGSSLGPSMLQNTVDELQYAVSEFLYGIRLHTPKSKPKHLKSPTNPLFNYRPTLHITLHARSRGLSKQAYGSRYLLGAGAAFVKTFFDKDIMSATSRVYGLHASINDYNRLVRTPNLGKVLEEFRNELPILAALLKTMKKAHWEHPFETFKLIRDGYFERGLTPAGWRFLKRISPVDVKKLLNEGLAFRICYRLKDPNGDTGQLPALIFLSEIGIFCHKKPRARLLDPLLNLYQVNTETARQRGQPLNEPRDPHKHFFRAFALHVLNSTDSVQNLRDLCSDASDAIKYATPNRINGLIGPRKITTARAMHILQIAHAEIPRVAKNKNEKLSWPPCLEEFEHKEFKFRELTTSDELGKEGNEMHHCIGWYGDKCLDGDIRIFSGTTGVAESRQKRISVALKRNEAGSWSIQQVRGFANRGATKEEKAATRALCRALAKAEIQTNKAHPPS